MKINKKKVKKSQGFTMIELIAVIVLLAVVLVVTVPKIQNMIENARIKSMESTAKLVASSLEKKYQASLATGDYFATSGNNAECLSYIKQYKRDYATCIYTVDEDTFTAKVTIAGKDGGKFSGFICENATKLNANCVRQTEETLLTYENVVKNYSAGKGIDSYKVKDKNLCESTIDDLVDEYDVILDILDYSYNDALDALMYEIKMELDDILYSVDRYVNYAKLYMCSYDEDLYDEYGYDAINEIKNIRKTAIDVVLSTGILEEETIKSFADITYTNLTYCEKGNTIIDYEITNTGKCNDFVNDTMNKLCEEQDICYPYNDFIEDIFDITGDLGFNLFCSNEEKIEEDLPNVINKLIKEYDLSRTVNELFNTWFEIDSEIDLYNEIMNAFGDTILDTYFDLIINAGPRALKYYLIQYIDKLDEEGIINKYDLEKFADVEYKCSNIITFNTNGGTMKDSTTRFIDTNKKIGKLPEAYKDGYTFMGWFTEKIGGEKYNEDVIIKGDLVLYAHYGDKENANVILTFDPDGGMFINGTTNPNVVNYYVETNNGTLAKGEVITKTSSSINEDGTRKKQLYDSKYYNRALSYTEEITIPGAAGLNFEIEYDIYDSGDLFAVYDKNVMPTAFNSEKSITGLLSDDDTKNFSVSGDTIRVYFNPDGDYDTGYGYYITVTNKEYVDMHLLSGNPNLIPTKEGYTFDGWYDLDGNEYDQNESYTKSATFTARWLKHITVTFDAQGGTIDKTTKQYIVGTKVGSYPVPTKPGYVFAGWYTEPNMEGYHINKKTIISTEEDITVYAGWETGYLITFDPMGGTCDTEYITVEPGEYKASLPIPVKEGYVFDGWFTESTGGIEIINDEYYTIESNITWYAHWSNTYTITFDAQGGNVNMTTKKVSNNRLYGVLPKPTRTNYRFIGWFTDIEGGTQITIENTVSLTENQTLYAHWMEDVDVLLTFYDFFEGEFAQFSNGSYVNKIGYNIEKSTPSVIKTTSSKDAYGNRKTSKDDSSIMNEEKTSTGKLGESITIDGAEQLLVTVYYSLGKEYKLKIRYYDDYITLTGGNSKTTYDNKVSFVVSGDTVMFQVYPDYDRDDYVGEYYGYYAEVSEVPVVTSKTLVFGDDTLTPTFKNLDRIFDYWENEITNEKYDSNKTYFGNATFFASWRDYIKIDFVDETDEYNYYSYDKKVYEKDKFGELPTPTKEGYTFAGWRDWEGNIITSDTIFDTDNYYYDSFKLYAMWKIDETPNVTLTFDANGGYFVSGTTKELKYYYDGNSSQLVSGNLSLIPVNNGYKFMGWTDANGNLFNTKHTFSSDKTYYAIWAKYITITFDYNGGTGSRSTMSLYPDINGYIDESILPVAAKSGYAFIGWTYEDDDIWHVKIEDDITLVAEYAKINTLTLDPNGGQISQTTFEIVDYYYYPVLPTPTNGDLIFDGWYTEKNGGTFVDLEEEITIEGDHTLYAHWLENNFTHTVTFDADGGKCDITSKTIIDYEHYHELPEPTKEGYIFIGWFKEKQSTNPEDPTRVTKKTIFDDEKDITIYAWWSKIISVYLDYNLSGHSNMYVDEVLDEYYVLLKPTDDNYKFVGWYTERVGGTLVTEDTIVTNENTHTLYAHWVKGLEQYSWAEIKIIGDKLATGELTYEQMVDTYNIELGDIKKATINGETHKYRLVGVNQDVDAGGNYLGMTFVQTDFSNDTYPFSTPDSNLNWENSTLRSTINSFTIEPSLDAVISSARKTSIKNYEPRYTIDKLWITSEYEMFGTNGYTYNYHSEGEPYDYFSSIYYSTSFIDNLSYSDYWWTRTYYSGYYFAKGYKEYSSYGYYTNRYYILVAFCVGSTNKKIVFLDPNDGTITADSPWVAYNDNLVAKGIDGTTYGSLLTPERNNYDFLGWYTESTGGTKVESTSTIASNNVTLYAHWRLRKNVTLNAMGGTITAVNNWQQVTSSTIIKNLEGCTIYEDLPTPVRDNYWFEGWYTDTTYTTKILSTTNIISNDNHTLYAKWKQKLIITLDLDNGTITKSEGWTKNSSSIYEKDSTYISNYETLPTITKSGYKFKGWYYDSSFNTLISNNDSLNSSYSHTIYAKFIPNYYVVLDSQGGTINASGSWIQLGADKMKKDVTALTYYGELPNPTKINNYFEGWYTSTSYITKVISSTSILSESDHTLYAKWKEKNVVTLDANGGTYSTYDGWTYISDGFVSKDVTYSSTYSSLPEPMKEGYIFGGWYTSNLYTTKITGSSSIASSESHVLYAKWVERYYVTLNANGGNIIASGDWTQLTPSTVKMEYNSLSTYSTLIDPTRSGYIFKGWYTDTTYTTKVISSSSVVSTSNHSLYAKWIEEYYVTLNPSDGTFGTTTGWESVDGGLIKKNVSYTSTYGTLPSPTKSNYTFAGWYTESTGGTLVTSSSTVTEGNHTLYAHWDALPVNITLNALDGSITAPTGWTQNTSSTITKGIPGGGEYGELPTPVKTGYMFDGWYTDNLYTNHVVSTTVMTNFSAHMLYAKWVKDLSLINVTLTFDADGGTFAGGSETNTVGYYSTYKGNLTTVQTVNTSSKGTNSARKTSITDSTNYLNNLGYTDTITIPGASKLRITVYYSTESATYDWLCIFNSSTTAVSTCSGSISGKLGGYTTASTYSYQKTYDVEGDTLQIYFRSDSSVTNYGYWAVIQNVLEQTSIKLQGDETLVPTKTGYIFEKFVDGDGNDYDESATYSTNTTFTAQYKKQIVVTLNPMDGTVNPTTKDLIEGNTYGDLPTPSKTNANFLGWYTESTGGTQVLSTTSITNTNDHTLYAHWQNHIIVTFNPTGGTCLTSTKNVTGLSTYGTLPTPINESKIFTGWFTEISGGTKVTADTLLTITENQTLYAHWTDPITLTFDPVGGTVSPTTKSIVYEFEYGDLPIPTKDGYAFAGWYTESTGGTLITTTSVVSNSSSHTIYAHWTNEPDIILTFDADGGTFSNGASTNELGYSKTLTGTVYTKTTSSINSNGTRKTGIDDLTTLKASLDYYDVITIPNASLLDVTIYYQTSSYDALCVSNYIPTSYCYNTLSGRLRGQNTSTSNIDYTKHYYVEGDTAIISFYTNSYTQYYGYWAEVTNEPSVTTVTKLYGDNTLVPTKTSKVFGGWYDSDGNKYDPNKKYLESTTFTALWGDASYTITFDANGGSVNESTRTVVYGQKLGELPLPTLSDHKFLGWYYYYEGGELCEEVCDEDCWEECDEEDEDNCWEECETNCWDECDYDYYDEDYVRYSEKSTYNLKSNITLKAFWNTTSYVTLDANGGTIEENPRWINISSSKAKVATACDDYYGECDGTVYFNDLMVPTKENNVFLGWYTTIDDSCSSDEDYCNEQIRNEEYYDSFTTLYARWAFAGLTLTLNSQGGLFNNTSGWQTITNNTIVKEFDLGTTLGELPTPSREGFTFSGWYTDLTYTTAVSATSQIVVGGSKMYYAKWTPKTDLINKHITFDAGSGKFSNGESTNLIGLYVKTLDEPVSMTETISSKSISGNRKTSIEDTTNYANNLSYYDDITIPGAESIDVTIYYSTESTTYDWVSLYSPTVTPTSSNYSSSISGRLGGGSSNNYSGTYNYTLTGDTARIYFRSDGSNVYYGYWATVTGLSTKYSTRLTGDDTLLPTWEGHTFVNWVDSNNNLYSPSMNYYDDITFTATWLNNYIITFDATGGTTDTETKEVINTRTYGDLPTPTRSGYVFIGWYTASSGGTKITNTSTVNLSANQTLYAQWNQQFTLTVNAGDGTIPSTSGWKLATSKKTATKTVTNTNTYGTLPNPTRSGYVFAGWYTESTGGTKIISSTTVSLSANQTLYAHWNQQFTLTASANDGTIFSSTGWTIASGNLTATKTVTNTNTYGDLPSVSRDGYVFDGWYTESTGGTKIESTTTVDLTANQTIYAHWTSFTEVSISSFITNELNNTSSGIETFMFDSTYAAVTTSPTYIEYRYTGATPNNYVVFNGELWRIIGLFKDTNGNYQLKIIKSESIGSKAWNSTTSNQWLSSSLYTYLTGTYYPTLSSTAKSMVDTSAVFNMNALPSYKVKVNAIYVNEQTLDTSGFTKTYNNPTANIGIMTMSDYGFAARSACRSSYSLYDYDNSSCKNYNWLNIGLNQWVINPDSTATTRALYITTSAYGYIYSTSTSYYVRPVLYLKSSIKINGGSGTSTNPYSLG